MQLIHITNWKNFLCLMLRKATIKRKHDFKDTKAAQIYFEYQLKNGWVFWDAFRTELREKRLHLQDFERRNLYEDLKIDFYPYIEQYLSWYNENKQLQDLEYFFIYQAFYEFFKDTKDEIERTNPLKVKRPVLKGFQSSMTDEQIQILFDNLKGSYIDINTNPDHFKAIFRTGTLPRDCSIKWLKTNVLLAYLIKKIFHSDNPFDVWIKAEKIFGIKNLRQSENNPYPKGFNEIDVILKIIYPHLQ